MMAHFGEAGFCASETTPVVVEDSDSAEILLVNRHRRLTFIEVFYVRSVDGSKNAHREKEGHGR